MKSIYLLWSVDKILIGAFSYKMDAEDFAIDHRMLDGYYVEQTELSKPSIGLLKDGTY